MFGNLHSGPLDHLYKLRLTKQEGITLTKEEKYQLACICLFMHKLAAMNQAVQILSVLSEPTRFEAMRLLWDGREHCVCELMEVLEKGQSTMSRHMTALKKVGLVVDRRDAQWVRYRRNPALPAPVVALVDAALKIAKGTKTMPAKRLCRKAA